jgi:hypothetical protein
MIAVLKDAIMRYKKYCRKQDPHFQEARRWLFERDADHVFSFEHICAVLGLSPKQVRCGLLGLAESHKGRW